MEEEKFKGSLEEEKLKDNFIEDKPLSEFSKEEFSKFIEEYGNKTDDELLAIIGAELKKIGYTPDKD